MSEPLEHARRLLGKAANDITSAEVILASGLVFDSVAFHAQQAAKKSLKALLAAEDVVYPRTHDLERLLTLLQPVVPTAQELVEDLVLVSPITMDVRYGEAPEPEPEEAASALEAAKRVHQFAEQTIAEREATEATEEGAAADDD